MFFIKYTATTKIYTYCHTLSLHDALPISVWSHWIRFFGEHFRYIRHDERGCGLSDARVDGLTLSRWVDDLESVVEAAAIDRSEEHTSELQSLMRISYAVFCLKKKRHTLPIHDSPHLK